MITRKVNVCVVAKHFPQKVRDKPRALKKVILNHPDQLTTHSLRYLWKLPPLAKTFVLLDWFATVGTVVSSFRNQSDCWSHLPPQRRWSHCCFIIIRISWKFIHYQMSVSNGWVLSQKIWLLSNICISQRPTRLSSHFCLVVRLLKRRKMSK